MFNIPRTPEAMTKNTKKKNSNTDKNRENACDFYPDHKQIFGLSAPKEIQQSKQNKWLKS